MPVWQQLASLTDRLTDCRVSSLTSSLLKSIRLHWMFSRHFEVKKHAATSTQLHNAVMVSKRNLGSSVNI